MKRFPAFFDLNSQPVPVIGGGEAALAKARLAIAAGAKVNLIWPEIEPAVTEELADRAAFHHRKPEASDFDGARLVFLAIEDADEAARLAALAKRAGAQVNVVDQPDLCDFTTPSIIDRGEVTVAISTDGAAPVLGRKLRAQIEALLPQRIGALASFAQRHRDSVKAKIAQHDRKAFWEKFFDGPVATRVLAGDERQAHEAMLATVNRSDTDNRSEAQGVVHIVGAGPGDPDLLTLKALRLLQSADVILYDRLVGDEILALARRDAERFYVGKAKADHSVPQREIEQRMIDMARAGKTVVRLKGGDPFVFGRGGEELEALKRADVDAYIVPGITAATGCAAAAGLPLTHRDFAQSVTFVTGHAKSGGEPDLDWKALAALQNTLVVYMGVGAAANISRKLIDHGRAASTPAAVIENGTRANQKIVKGELSELAELIDAAGIKGPALLVIGETAALAHDQSISEFVQPFLEQERLIA